MKKVLLIRNSIKIFGQLEAISPPLGLMYLASVLRKNFAGKVEVRIIDLRLFQYSLTELDRNLLEFRPDVVGISTLTYESKMMHVVAGMAKTRVPGCRVVVGGPHPTIYYEQVLEDRNIDYAVVGEGEDSFLELMNHLEGNGRVPPLKGVAFREDESVVFPGKRPAIEDIDSLPFPAWDLIAHYLDSYVKCFDFNRSMGGGRKMGIFSSRSCPYQCVYCHSIFDKGFRARSPENVLEEIRILRDQYAIKEFQIFDDCFNLDLPRAKRIGEMISARVPGIRICFPNGFRTDIADLEFLQIFRRAGAYALAIAVESASPRIQKLIRKNLNLERVKEIVSQADRLKYFVQGFFMIGFPTETREEIKMTVDFALNSPMQMASFWVVVPYRGTELMRIFHECGIQEDFDFENCIYSPRMSAYRAVTGTSLFKIKRKAYLRFYSNPIRWIKGMRRIHNRKKYIWDNFASQLTRYFFNFKGI